MLNLPLNLVRINTIVASPSIRSSFINIKPFISSPLTVRSLQPSHLRLTSQTPRHFTTTTSHPFKHTPAKMTVHNLADKTSFQTSVVDQKDKITLVDFFATWCGPCKVIAPKIASMSEDAKYSDVGFYKVDVDEVSDVAGELGIRAMPTFLVFKNGEQVEEIVGANLPAITAALDKYL